MTRFILALMIIIVLSGCETIDTMQMAKSMYNVEETGTSEFDGTQYIRMSNIGCSGEQIIRLDLYQDSRLAQHKQALLKAKVTGIHTIDGGKSLHFNIDGDFIALETIDNFTETEEVYPAQYTSGFVGGGTYIPPIYAPATVASTKRYTISEELIRKIAEANKVIVRVDLSRTYVEGLCSPQEYGWTKENEWFKELSGTAGFRRFIEMINAEN